MAKPRRKRCAYVYLVTLIISFLQEFPLRPHLASLVDDFQHNGRQIAVVSSRGVRRHITTYADLATLAGRFAAELDRRSIAPGDRVILWGENSAEWIGAFFGCILRGVLAVPLDAAGSADFAARVIADTSPRLILANAARHTALPPSIPQLSLDTLDATLPDYPLFAVAPTINLDTPFQIVFTSGTTAEPKGIVHTHRNVLASLEPIEKEIAKYRRYERIVHPLRFLHTLPLSHVFGQFMGLWTPVLLAAEVHFESQLEPARLLDRIRRNRISVLVAVPRSLELLRSHLHLRFPELESQLAASSGLSLLKRMVRFRRIHSLTGWKFWALISGGATLPPALEFFWGHLGYAVIQGYGMTETAALITLNHPFHMGRGTLGKPLPGREVRLSPEGEILVRGDVVSISTWANGKMQPRSSEWLATGDLAVENTSGELRFTGRRGDTIVTAAGLNIYPADLEAELLKQPGIRAAAVVGFDGPNGPEPVAVVLPDASLADTQSLNHTVQQANESLASFQQIRHALRWPEPSLPYTSTGKLLRRRVASWASDQLAATAAHPAAPSGDILLEMIATVTGESPAEAPDSAQLSADLHLDSLARVQLQSLLEQRFGLDLTDEQIAQARTLGDLRALIGTPTLVSSDAPNAPLNAESTNPGQVHTGHSTSRPKQSQPSPTPTLKHRYPLWPWLPLINWLRVAFQELVIRPLVWILAAPHIQRSAMAPKGPVLIVANHLSAYDVPLVLYGLPLTLGQRVAVAMSGEMLLDFRRGRGLSNALHSTRHTIPRELRDVLDALLPIAYWLLTTLFNVFPLPRLGGFRRSFEHAGDALDRGYSVLIFPEGHRSDDGTLQPFRAGIGLLAQQAQVSVLAVAIHGLAEVKRTGGHWFRSGRLTVRVGDLIPYDPKSTPEQTTERLHAAMAALLA